MEILALYSSADSLETALSAGARQLASAVDGFALIYLRSAQGDAPHGWAGLASPQDAALAGAALRAFREQTLQSERPLRCEAPTEPARLWQSAAGGVYGFPLALGGQTRGVAIAGCPGAWPRKRSSEFESTLRQIALVLDHHAVSKRPAEAAVPVSDPSDDLLQLSE